MQGFREAVQSNLSWFEGTKLIVISNTLWVGEKVCHTCRMCHRSSGYLHSDIAASSHQTAPFSQVPCLTYGMRGMISASIEVKGPQRDLHSGNEGGKILSMALRLIHGRAANEASYRHYTSCASMSLPYDPFSCVGMSALPELPAPLELPDTYYQIGWNSRLSCRCHSERVCARPYTILLTLRCVRRSVQRAAE